MAKYYLLISIDTIKIFRLAFNFLRVDGLTKKMIGQRLEKSK